nr:hypothetical protein [Myxococcota bacterium]
ATGCAGGLGGQGGNGGGGGGGAGGVSVGILYSGGLEPDVSGVTFMLGEAGEGGDGGGTDNSGLPGKSAKLLPIGP